MHAIGAAGIGLVWGTLAASVAPVRRPVRTAAALLGATGLAGAELWLISRSADTVTVFAVASIVGAFLRLAWRESLMKRRTT